METQQLEEPIRQGEAASGTSGDHTPEALHELSLDGLRQRLIQAVTRDEREAVIEAFSRHVDRLEREFRELRSQLGRLGPAHS